MPLLSETGAAFLLGAVQWKDASEKDASEKDASEKDEPLFGRFGGHQRSAC